MRALRIATWNLNNRVGRIRFRPEAADAAAALGGDLLVFTEFYPQHHEAAFRDRLSALGFGHQLMSMPVPEVANRVLVASRVHVKPHPVELPAFDHQFPSNLLAVEVPDFGLSLLGVRVPAYTGATGPLLLKAWDWLETFAASHRTRPMVLLGDFNVGLSSTAAKAGGHFRRILQSGWTRAEPSTRSTYFGHRGTRSEIDHILGSRSCMLLEPEVVMQRAGFSYASEAKSISDHAALLSTVVAS